MFGAGRRGLLCGRTGSCSEPLTRVSQFVSQPFALSQEFPSGPNDTTNVIHDQWIDEVLIQFEGLLDGSGVIRV